MDISVIGATGDCGREIAVQIVNNRLLDSREILQLISSNPQSSRPAYLEGLRADLQDAYAERIPEIDVASHDAPIIGDIVIFAAGKTIETDVNKAPDPSRNTLAKANKPLFEKYARILSESRSSNPPLVIVVTNPVELGVAIFASYLPREYVLGMGAFSDSLRFRAEIAKDLGIRRQRVQGYVFGEHGTDMVPAWSTVKIHGFSQEEQKHALKALRRGYETRDFTEHLSQELERVKKECANNPSEATRVLFEHIENLPPDLRIALKPAIIHFTSAKTPLATAGSTVEMIRSIIEGQSIEISVQYQFQGEAGLSIPFGTRVIVSNIAERITPFDGLDEEEMSLLYQAASRIKEKIQL